MPEGDSGWGDLAFGFGSAIIDELSEAQVRVVAVCCDNGSPMKKAAKLLCEKYPGLVSVPCSVHTLQLVVRDLEKVDVVKRTIEKVKELQGHTGSSFYSVDVRKSGLASGFERRNLRAAADFWSRNC